MISLQRLLIPFVALLVMPLQAPLQNQTAQAKAAALGSLGGAWRGSGRMRLGGGKTERLRCRAYYRPRAGGTRLGMAIRCASASYKIELRSQLAVRGRRVTGSWEERTFNAGGRILGTSRPGRLTLAVSGSVNAKLLISYRGRTQSVRLITNISGFKGMTIALSK